MPDSAESNVEMPAWLQTVLDEPPSTAAGGVPTGFLLGWGALCSLSLGGGAVMGFKIARKHVGWFFEAELREDYLSLKRAFNALTSQDAQEQFFSDASSEILTRIEAHRTQIPHRRIAPEEVIAA